MKFGFTKDESKRLDAFVGEIENALGAYEDARNEYNEAVKAAFEKFSGAISSLNESRDNAHSFLDGLASEHRDAYDERSEKWQEGDAGQNANTWIEQIESARDALAFEFSIEEPSEVDDDPDFSRDTLKEIAPDAQSV